MRYIAILLCLTAWATAQQTPNPCAAAEQQQLSFWVGEWDLTWPGAQPNEVQHGTNSIRRILDGCVVQENFSGGTDIPLRGTSISLFDRTAKKWKQTWVDNEGSYLDFVGEFKDGQMILWRDSIRADGTKGMQRMIFKNITPDEFDWSWEGSKDGGKTWQVVWPIHYKRHK
ncbi:MAG TPA: DUF1579 family protein [Terriglobales bacterium]|jgi:hypothetical protein|nr:DUF1579 family protein [Terriglobales bacterium]